MLITLGTSHIIRKDNGMVISCGTGIPREKWRLEMLTVEETVAGLESILESIKKIRGEALPNVLFTISPQRYWFGNDILGGESPVVDNCLSKSILRVALDQLIKNHAGESVFYFPAFELVIDELRVYVHDPKNLKEADVDCVIIASVHKEEIALQLRELRPDLPVFLKENMREFGSI